MSLIEFELMIIKSLILVFGISILTSVRAALPTDDAFASVYEQQSATWTAPEGDKARKAFFRDAFGGGRFDLSEALSLIAAKGPNGQYDEKEIAQLERLFRRGTGRAAGPETECGRRIAVLKRKVLDPIVKRSGIITGGIHSYQPENYIPPSDLQVQQRLETFRDRKLGLMIHFGLYSQLGIIESWPLVDAEASWSRCQVDWTDGESFKREYLGLIKSFNPLRLQPEVWAETTRRNGFKYLVFTTKHHDGFCLFDSKHSNFKVTSPACPYSTHAQPDIVRAVFDAFRAKGLGISCYFSKPDWHHVDYWENFGLGYQTDRMPSYDVEEQPERWARYRQFVRNQILELMSGYGQIDCLWLDGGQVQRRYGLDIGIEDIVAEARKLQPGLIAVDRAVGNTCEDVITPEQTVPPVPLSMPWESCITMGGGFSYRYDDTFKSPRELVHLLIDVVAKGGNLALNVAPGPDGRLPTPAVERMDAMGEWLKGNGEAIYATRVLAPYRVGDWAFTQDKEGVRYAIRLWREGEARERTLQLPESLPFQVGSVVRLATGERSDVHSEKGRYTFDFAADDHPDPFADAFRLEPPISSVSPDGRNEVRLSLAPLAYEVYRDGERMVTKSRIDLRLDGRNLSETVRQPKLTSEKLSGHVMTPVYKKSSVDLSGNSTVADFGGWAVRLVARNDGVAYRFEIKRGETVTVNKETATVVLPSAESTCWMNRTPAIGCEETVNETVRATEISLATNEVIYLPFGYEVAGKTVLVAESDVHDYPILNFRRDRSPKGVSLESVFAGYPKSTERKGRHVNVLSSEEDLVRTDGVRPFPWRAFLLADQPTKLMESDLIFALARGPNERADFSWVRPGKVAWDWWNAFDNIGDPEGCTTKTYERFIDFAAANGIEYVILDEGWSEKLNIWKFHPNVDVKHLIEYAAVRKVGIILWMAWSQVVGDEERVAREFAKLDVKGFKVDFMDRGDAEAERFLWRFAEACAQNRMLVDYHGAHHPTGMSRAYPNVINYEGVHGLEWMKFHRGEDILGNDVKIAYLRMSVGPLDYTPGAMDNFRVGTYPRRQDLSPDEQRRYFTNPGSLGTRARQMAMLVLYEAPLQMLCDSPTKYERNPECLKFMADVPVVWNRIVGLPGSPDTVAAVARQAKDGSWYAAAIGDSKAREYTLETDFLGDGDWQAELFRDGNGVDAKPSDFTHETRRIRAGETFTIRLAPGGGFVIKFQRN